MGIFKFFNRFKDTFHRVKGRIGNTMGKFINKYAGPVVNIVKKATGFIDKTPLGPILSKMTGGIYDTAKKVISYLPDGTVKDNASKFADKAKETAGSAISRVERIQEKAKDWIDRGRKINGTIVHGLRKGLGNGPANGTGNGPANVPANVPANGLKMSFGFNGANM